MMNRCIIRRSLLSARNACNYNVHLRRDRLTKTVDRNSTRMFSSSGGVEDEKASSSSGLRFPLSSLSLGLSSTFVLPHLESISQLPEVKVVLEQNTLSQSMVGQEEGLLRAIDIFSSMGKGGNEHKAVLALLAEYFQSMGKFEKALDILKSLTEFQDVDDDDVRVRNDLILARAKAFWLNGNFTESKVLCGEMLRNEAEMSRLPLHHAAARSGVALSRLLLAETIEDAFALRDPPRMVIRLLENQPPSPYHPLAIALAQLNHGCSQVIWARLVSDINNVDAPLDGAMRAWNDGLGILDSSYAKKEVKEGPLMHSIRARLQANMAWGVLQMSSSGHMDPDPDGTKKASGLAGKAIKSFDKLEDVDKEGFGRALALTATCYHRSGSAVTAEGLLQTAMDLNNNTTAFSPQQKIDQREILLTYSRLLKDWEKRESEGEKIEQEALAMEDQELVPGWRGKSPIVSSLWFWTPNLLVDHL